jgi:hypothetical protein
MHIFNRKHDFLLFIRETGLNGSAALEGVSIYTLLKFEWVRGEKERKEKKKGSKKGLTISSQFPAQ